ncbi:hypothetical protein BGX27_008963 [Mortierella sp. AM989]|nr:hypothetical protein BGX27_008963 [Mortierella sp. AM989]
MNDFSERHPTCVHSAIHHNTMSISDQSYAGSISCSCEECSRYKLPLQSEQSSAAYETLQQQYANTAANSASMDRNSTATSSTSPPTTYFIRRTSASNTTTSPKMMPAGFGLGGSSAMAAQMRQHQRRASLEFNNRERSFQQHSTACDCRGSGVGCGCSFTCDC